MEEAMDLESAYQNEKINIEMQSILLRMIYAFYK